MRREKWADPRKGWDKGEGRIEYLHAQDIPAATESAGQAAAAVDGVFHVLAAGEEAGQEEQDDQEQGGKKLLFLCHLLILIREVVCCNELHSFLMSLPLLTFT